MEQREYISSEKEGWLLKQGGRIKTWKKRYVILSGNALYYFKKPNDRAPAGFVPLEGIDVILGADKRSFELRPKATPGGVGGFIKSARLQMGGKGGGARGGFKTGKHKAFHFRVVGANDRTEEWVRAVQEHTVGQQVRSAPAPASPEGHESSPKATFSFFRGKARPKPAHVPTTPKNAPPRKPATGALAALTKGS